MLYKEAGDDTGAYIERRRDLSDHATMDRGGAARTPPLSSSIGAERPKDPCVANKDPGPTRKTGWKEEVDPEVSQVQTFWGESVHPEAREREPHTAIGKAIAKPGLHVLPSLSRNLCCSELLNHRSPHSTWSAPLCAAFSAEALAGSSPPSPSRSPHQTPAASGPQHRLLPNSALAEPATYPQRAVKPLVSRGRRGMP